MFSYPLKLNQKVENPMKMLLPLPKIRCKQHQFILPRLISTATATANKNKTTNKTTNFKCPPRSVINFDVVIVGAGPAGLSAALRLKQLDPKLSVVVLEKASQLGNSHCYRYHYKYCVIVIVILLFRWTHSFRSSDRTESFK